LPILLFKVTDAARIMKVSGSTVRRRIRTGDVPVFKLEGVTAARKARRK
jgi:hypothetical protein